MLGVNEYVVILTVARDYLDCGKHFKFLSFTLFIIYTSIGLLRDYTLKNKGKGKNKAVWFP